MNDSYSNSTFSIFLFETQFIVSNYRKYTTQGITLFNCQCNVFWSSIAIIIAAFYRRTVASSDIRFALQDAHLEDSLRKKKKSCIHVLFSLFYIFWYFRFSFSNLKDHNSFMFLWCIVTSSLTVCSWCYMTYK